MTVNEHITCGNAVILFLQEVESDTQKTSTRPARYDILLCVILVTNKFVESRLICMCKPTQANLNRPLGDLHGLIIWIAKYQNILRHVYCPQRAVDKKGNPKKLKPHTACGIFDYLQGLCERYVNGKTPSSKHEDDGASGGASSHLQTHCRKVRTEISYV